MALKNTVIPNEKLSSRERIHRKIRSFDGRPFTLREINRLLRPRMKLESIRFHVDNLVNNLLIEKLPREGREPQLYVERDLLKYIQYGEASAAYEYLCALQNIVDHLKAGHVIPKDKLLDMRTQIRVNAEILREDLEHMLMLHDCPDLWNPTTLVNRLGFNNVEDSEQ